MVDYVATARLVRLGGRMPHGFESIPTQIHENDRARPVERRTRSIKFRDLEMIQKGRLVTFERNDGNGVGGGARSITYFIPESGALVILSEPKYRAFYPEMEAHINATINKIVAKYRGDAKATA